MLELLIVAATGAGLFATYSKTRDFVRNRLRFVDVAQKRSAPVIAGFGATLAALPLVAVLPIVGGPTALLFGVSVGLGVKKGQKQIKQLTGS
jgi:hypothetical protein